MEKLIQYRTNASLYDGEFGGSSGWPAAGMGYIIVSKNGKIIVIDGGYGDDAEEMLSLLRKNSKFEIPHVDLWMTQTLETDSLYMQGNITINPIPSNYGLITWNGSILTVS